MRGVVKITEAPRLQEPLSNDPCPARWREPATPPSLAHRSMRRQESTHTRTNSLYIVSQHDHGQAARTRSHGWQ